MTDVSGGMSDVVPITTAPDGVRAVKLAEVRGRRHPRMHPVGRYKRKHYEHVETVAARCHRHDHPAPTLACTCGFYGVERVDLLPEVTMVLADSVVLDVEFGGIVVEHEMGYRAEEQTVLAVRFPDECAFCARRSSHVVPGRRWRSACGRCSARRRGALARAEATAMLGVDVDFVSLPAEPATSHLFGAVRALVMFVLALAFVVLGRRAGLSGGVLTALAVVAAMSFVACLATGVARSVRTHTTWFVLQCLLVLASGVTVFMTTR